MGYPIFYSDNFAKELLISNQEVQKKITEIIGEKAYLIDGFPNKKFIADSIFENPQLLIEMNAIIHPKVREGFTEWAKNQSSPLVFNEAAILFESGSYKNFDKTILVTAPLKLRIERIKKRDAISEAEILKRMENQWDDKKKIPLADFVIENAEDKMLLPQISKIVDEILDVRF